MPVAIKDNMCTKGLLTTCSSKILYNFVPTYTAEAVLNLEKAGAVILGKTNMDEFAMGSTTETSAYGVTKNPWNTGHVPGGSSGGSCAAVAAEECSYALGSDTGGSIRQPSSFCGVTGIKPTYGTVSRYGLIAYGSSLDQIGPIAKDVTDCATILEAIASHDVKDSTSVQREDYDFTSALVDDVRGMKIGIPRDYFGDGLDPEVKVAVLGAAKKLEEKGAIVEVADGYARNFLIRNRLAVQATAKSLEILDEQKVQAKLNEKEMEAQARETAAKLEKIMLQFSVKSGKEGRVFGSVSTKQIAQELERKHGIHIDKRKILDTAPIQSLGVTNVRIELYKDVIGTIRVQVTGKE